MWPFITNADFEENLIVQHISGFAVEELGMFGENCCFF